MSDERGRKRDTPTGIGPVKPRAGQAAPRGAGLSGDLPSGARHRANEPASRHPRPPEDPRRNYEPIHGGPWEGVSTPPRNVVEPPRRSPPAAPPAPPARGTSYHAPADAFAKTRPADAPREYREHQEQRPAAVRSEAPRTAAAGPSLRPGEPHKPSLRLKLDGATYDAPERVRVPKRRAPMLLGLLILLGTLGGGVLLWIDAHGGMGNFVQQLQRIANGEPAVTATPPVQATPPAAAPAASAEAPAAQPAAAPPAAAAPVTSATPAQAEKQAPQIATGEVEDPAEQAPAAQAAPAQPTAANDPAAAPGAEAPKPAAAKAQAAPKPPAKATPKPPRERPVARAPVRREPVLKIEQLGDGNATDRVLGAAPPDPGGGEMLPPPDPPAPE